MSLKTNIFSSTDLCMNDKVERLYTKILNRIRYFEREVNAAKDVPSMYYQKYRGLVIRYISFIIRLDRYKLSTHNPVYKEIYDEVKHWPDRKTHLFNEFAIKESEKQYKGRHLIYLMNRLEKGAREGAITRLEQRMTLELYESMYDGWHVVFNTLTVAPQHINTVFERGSNVWRNYIRVLQRKFPEGFRYICVTERGGETGKLHFHALMHIKGLKAVDPNAGQKIPYRREVYQLKAYWKYGFSTPIAVRFNNNDTYGRDGWRWPVEMDDKGVYEPLKPSEPGALGRYMIKYILKSKKIENETGKEYRIWKTRMTRMYGLRQLNSVICRMRLRQLCALTALPVYPMVPELYSMKISTKLIRILAVKEYRKRLLRMKKYPQKKENQSTLKQLMKHTIGQTSGNSRQNIGSMIVSLLNNAVIYDSVFEDYADAKAFIENEYPKTVKAAVINTGVI